MGKRKEKDEGRGIGVKVYEMEKEFLICVCVLLFPLLLISEAKQVFLIQGSDENPPISPCISPKQNPPKNSSSEIPQIPPPEICINFNVLFGCDGSNSVVRKEIEKKFDLPNSTNKYSAGYQEYEIVTGKDGKEKEKEKEKGKEKDEKEVHGRLED